MLLPMWVLEYLATSHVGSQFLRARSRLTVKLPQLDPRPIPKRRDEIRLFVCLRNEADLLPYFLDYYRRLGVARFLVVDHESTDASRDILLRQPDVHVFAASGSYARAEYGLVWIRELLYRYGVGCWCVLADADEFLVYPRMQQAKLPVLTAWMVRQQHQALECLLLDMYSERPIREAVYTAGQDPLEVCPCFDPASHFSALFYETVRGWFGGVRRRVFGVEPALRKVPLIKFAPRVYPHLGYHHVWKVRFAPLTGVMQHFKFFSRFHQTAQREAARGEHWNNASEYKTYWNVLQQHGDMCLADAGSQRYTGVDQLLRLNLMQDPPPWAAYVAQQIAPAAPSLPAQ